MARIGSLRIAGATALFPSIRGTALNSDTVALLLEERMRELRMAKRGRSFHSLRHSIATHLLEAGVDPKAVMRFMRHRSIETTMRYLHTARSGRWVGKLERLRPKPDPLDLRPMPSLWQ